MSSSPVFFPMPVSSSFLLQLLIITTVQKTNAAPSPHPPPTSQFSTSSSPPEEFVPASLSRRSSSSEILVPLNSTTALLCEPVFNQGQPREEAKWLRDGREVARVSGHSNAILDDVYYYGKSNGMDLIKNSNDIPNQNSSHHSSSSSSSSPLRDPIPEIGFLVIRQTRREHEGNYWCERQSDGQPGERTRLRVAFLEPFEEGARPRLVGPAEKGSLVVLECPKTRGVPLPILGWNFNGERLTDFPSLNMEIGPNSSLLLHNFSSLQSGFYACEAINFVARTVSHPLFLSAPMVFASKRFSSSSSASSFGFDSPASAPSKRSTFVDCLGVYVRTGVLWFLVGSLATSCLVLAYILGALFLYRRYCSSPPDEHRTTRRRTTQLLQQQQQGAERCFCPSLLFLAPGFRKVVAPMENERMLQQTRVATTTTMCIPLSPTSTLPPNRSLPSPPPPPYESLLNADNFTTRIDEGAGGESSVEQQM